MGGCCCCSSKSVEWNNSPQLYHYPVVPENQQPLSSHNSAASVVPTALLVDTNLDTSIPDTYRHPPPPIPYEPNSVDPQNTPVQTNSSDTNIKISNSDENVTKEAMESDMTEEVDGEVKKSNEPFVPPEECPTCLEEYDEENPKIVTKCEHHFHLSCILEWMERSNTCPVCDQVMELNE